MTVVIADDERLVRVGVASMLEEVRPDVHLLGEAQDGPGLVELCRRRRPDVAFVDIRMPGCDGFSAIEQAGKASASTLWIVLTSYAEFAYAKRALEIGALAYLLKPVAPDELAEVLRKADEVLSERRADRRARFADALHAALRERTDTGGGIDGRLVGGLLVEEPGAPHDELPGRGASDTEEIAQRVQGAPAGLSHVGGVPYLAGVPYVAGVSHAANLSYLGELPHVVATTGSGRLLSAVPLQQDERSREIRERYVAALRSILAESDAGSAQRQLVLLPDGCRLSELQRCIADIERALPYRILAGDNPVIDGVELLRMAGALDPDARRVCARLESVCAAYSSGGAVAALSTARALEEEVALDRLLADGEARRSIGCLLRRCTGFAGSTGDRRSFASELRHHLTLRLRSGGTRRTRTDYLVDATVEYIALNFHRDVGIAEIAEDLGVTANYLSSIVHNRTGRTFGEHLKEYRLERARQLLLSAPVRISRVAAEVGYRDPRHFTRLFRRRFGCAPQAYRQSGCLDRSENRPPQS